MTRIYTITHPEVIIDPIVPIPKWSLSPKGITRTQKMLRQPWIKDLQALYASNEYKAQDTAKIIEDHIGLKVISRATLGEIDRSSTGYIPPNRFKIARTQFFTKPTKSYQGWERAIDAQKRILKVVKAIAKDQVGKTIAIFTHGAVAALLLTDLKKVSIESDQDQPGSGGGNYFVFEADNWKLLQDWQPIDEGASSN